MWRPFKTIKISQRTLNLNGYLSLCECAQAPIQSTALIASVRYLNFGAPSFEPLKRQRVLCV